jgi:S-formylglutathione hydrolase FrmB
MKSVYRLIGISLLAIIILSVGCVKRDNPAVPETAPAGLIAWFTHQYDGITGANSIWNQYPARRVAVYTPPGYDFDNLIGLRYPTLYLLPGYDGEPSFNFEYGNETYYLAASIAKVADRLIASGEIKPMFIVMPDAAIPYGGSFYANSNLAGKWEDMRSVELVHKVDTLTTTETRPGSGFRTLAAKESRAIGGHSSGGYGAIRIAMTNDSLFNSVSAIDAPLAFDGSGSFGGITELFHAYLDESGITTDSQYLAADTTGFRAQPYKILFYSMAATFSPAAKTAATGLGNLQISLPFDYQGTPVQSVWDQWLANDLYTWLDNATYRNALKKQSFHFETSDHDVNMFNQQTQLFAQKLSSLGIEDVVVESASFSKYEEANARSRTFLYDRLEYILKFHSKHLRDRDGNY